MEVDKEIRVGGCGVENIKQALKQPVFFFIQIFSRKNQSLPKAVIRKGKVVEQIFLHGDLGELLVSLCHEKQFDGKGKPLRVLIEKGQKRIVVKFLQYQLHRVFFCQQFTQAGFPGSDIAFDADVFVRGRLIHPG